MTAKEKDNDRLAACLGKSRNLAELIDYAADAIVSKTVLDKPAGTITLFAFDAGQKLSEHTAPYDAVVEVVQGDVCLTIAGRDMDVSAGQIVIMPADIPHSVSASARCKLLLTMIRG